MICKRAVRFTKPDSSVYTEYMLRNIWAYIVYTWGGLHRYFGNKNHILMEHKLAVLYFSKAYEINPDFRQARLARAVILFRELNQINEALADFNALLAQDPQDGDVLFNRGLLYQQISNYKMALADFDAYLALPEPQLYWEEVGRTAVVLRDIIEERKRM